jgi:hypothetical protein
MQKLSSNTLSIFESATNEKDIENGYRYYFKTIIGDINFTSPYGCDGFGVSESLGMRVLCEFKDDLSLSSRNELVKVLCQSIYYIKKFELSGQKLPKTIFIGDRNECLVLHVNDVFHYLSINFDWNIAPSNAHKNLDLYQKLFNDDNINPFIFSVEDLPTAIDKCKDLNQNVKRLIPVTPHNITEVYNYFEKNVVGSHKLSTNELSNLFIQILISPGENYLHPIKGKKVVVTKNFGEVPVKSKEAFESFFSHFSREYTPREKEALTSIVDRLVEDTTRRKQGEFFTPTIWVDKAHEYISSVFGEDWKEKYVVWDPAWGTGNLTRDYKFKELYVSTLNQSDIDTANQMGYNPEATKFQFDFLNDPDEKLPQGFRNAIENGKEIIVFMNPPYGKAIGGKGVGSSKNTGNTLINKEMISLGLDKSSSNLYSQFLFKLINLKKIGVKIKLCFFSPPLFLSGEGFKKFRKIFLKSFGYNKGFIFQASNFSDVSEDWGIVFSLFEEKENLGDDFLYDILLLDKENYYIMNKGIKKIYNTDKKTPLSKFIKNNFPIEEFPKLSSPLKIKETNGGFGKPKNSFGVLVSAANNVMENNQNVRILTGGNSSNHGKFFFTLDNIFECSIIFSVRKLIIGQYSNWLNQKDEYLIPNLENDKYRQFKIDSLLISIFHIHSFQSSLRQVTYKEKLWDIKNEFFWMSKNEMLELSNQNNYSDLYNDARTDSDRYVYKLLFGEERIYDKLSPDAKLVLDKATELVRKSMQMREIFANDENHLKSWDAGYAQLKLIWKEYYADEFKEFRQLYKNLEDRMRPLVYELGFLLK